MSIELPPDAEARAMTFRRLSAETKKKLIDSVRAYDVADQPEVLAGILRQSGAASELFQHILGKETDSLVTHNKRLNPIHTK